MIGFGGRRFQGVSNRAWWEWPRVQGGVVKRNDGGIVYSGPGQSKLFCDERKRICFVFLASTG